MRFAYSNARSDSPRCATVASARITSGYAQPSHWSISTSTAIGWLPTGRSVSDAGKRHRESKFQPATSLFKAIFTAKAVKSNAFTSCPPNQAPAQSFLKGFGTDYESLVDAKVRLRGDQAPLFNSRGAMTGAYLLFPNRAQVMVEEPAPARPFTLPISPVSSLLHFTPKPASNHRVHIRGIVTLAWPGRMLCIQDGPEGLCAQTDQTTPLSLGALADVI